jgi:hypothetical protein
MSRPTEFQRRGQEARLRGEPREYALDEIDALGGTRALMVLEFAQGWDEIDEALTQTPDPAPAFLVITLNTVVTHTLDRAAALVEMEPVDVEAAIEAEGWCGALEAGIALGARVAILPLGSDAYALQTAMAFVMYGITL